MQRSPWDNRKLTAKERKAFNHLWRQVGLSLQIGKETHTWHIRPQIPGIEGKGWVVMGYRKYQGAKLQREWWRVDLKKVLKGGICRETKHVPKYVLKHWRDVPVAANVKFELIGLRERWEEENPLLQPPGDIKGALDRQARKLTAKKMAQVVRPKRWRA